MGLFSPAWMSENKEKALRAVAALTNEATLTRAALESPCWQAREAAVNKLTNQAVLAHAVVNDNSISVRLAAVEKLTAQSVLADIAKISRDYSVLKAAVTKLTDQTALAYVAMNVRDRNIRLAAIEKLTDRNMLADLIQNETDEKILDAVRNKLAVLRKNEVANITDQRTLAFIAKNDEASFVRLAAVEKLTDQSALTDIAKNDDSDFVRMKAADRITDKTILTEVLIGIDFSLLYDAEMKRLCARITDVALIKKIAAQCKSKVLRNYCCEKSGGHLWGNDCKCSICGIQNHDYKETGRGQEKSEGGHAVSFDVFYRCSRCGAEKTELGYNYTDC